MYKRILVPLDGSELAEGALPYVEELAKRFKSEAILLTVHTLGDYLELPLRAYLEKKARELDAAGVKASTMLIEGNAAVEILDFAGKSKVDLIVISAHGHSGFSDWALGGIAYKVLQRSHLPIILIRSQGLQEAAAQKGAQRILVPLDGSKLAEGVIPHIEGLAKGAKDEVFLLRVTEPIKTPHFVVHSGGFDWERYEKELLAQVENEAKHYLDRREKALSRKRLKVTSVSLVGKPTPAILKFAGDNAINLIALSSYGLSGITKWVFGSVASKVIHNSSQSILLIRPQSSS